MAEIDKTNRHNLNNLFLNLFNILYYIIYHMSGCEGTMTGYAFNSSSNQGLTTAEMGYLGSTNLIQQCGGGKSRSKRMSRRRSTRRSRRRSTRRSRRRSKRSSRRRSKRLSKRSSRRRSRQIRRLRSHLRKKHGK